MMDPEEYYRARDILEDLLRKDLYGPVSEDEIISDTWPDDYYICGRLFPGGTPVSEDQMDNNQLCDDVEEQELPVNLCYSSMPSSMAFSFTVRPGVTKLAGEAKFAWYEPAEPFPDVPNIKGYKDEWQRLSETVDFEFMIDPAMNTRVIGLHSGLDLRVYLYQPYSDGSRTVTLAMVNTYNVAGIGMDRRSRCSSTYFQVGLSVHGESNDPFPFIAKKPLIKQNLDPELLNLEMLFRHNTVFATGHGCSVDWESRGEYASRIWTEHLPAYEVMQMEPARHVRTEILSFSFLGTGSTQEICSGLKEIADSYDQWINNQEEVAGLLLDRYRNIGKANIEKCRESLQRIRTGIELLAGDGEVRQAFQLMNRAMLNQRKQVDNSQPDPCWYPFQLAFVLQVLGSVASHGDPWRAVVDLLWFPTGGGKTEAYLGLAAFTIFLRLLRAVRESRSGGGVTIIMRYTLRLLTLQQFERAAGLICACELIRRDNADLLGDSEIAAGLWVGEGLTPNKLDKAEKILEKIRKDGIDKLQENEPNPCQILACPWCKTEIKPQHYGVVSDRLLIICPREKCPFHEGLPVYLIDEEIYRRGPALLVGTVDKYARMTWQPDAGKLFGKGTDWLPPELIIQDELHLISGPLGTIAGLYEVAIDELCRQGDTGAKIISSTATIRHAAGQINSLYGRDCRQFPPQGLDIRDSYYALEAGKEDRPARRYLGVLAPGVSGNTCMIRVYAVLLAGRDYLARSGFSQGVVDSFWTLTGYFNTLKQLGGAVVNVYDDVMARLGYLYDTKFNMFFPGKKQWLPYLETGELTGRKKSSEIAGLLKKLETSYPDEDVYDVVLASSMLSVGVDIGRLGLMVVRGQPKSSSEYIQATSRIGRRTPGFVVTMYDASRSRDRSHYEHFRAYHASLYRYVEAASLTPFAERARERALHAVFISLCRQFIPELRSNEGASRISTFRATAEEIINGIVERAGKVEPSEMNGVREELFGILERWEELAGTDLVYEKFGSQKCLPLLTNRFGSDESAFPTLNSMREVDVECRIILEV